jgi:hypothetical protein
MCRARWIEAVAENDERTLKDLLNERRVRASPYRERHRQIDLNLITKKKAALCEPPFLGGCCGQKMNLPVIWAILWSVAAAANEP